MDLQGGTNKGLPQVADAPSLETSKASLDWALSNLAKLKMVGLDDL